MDVNDKGADMRGNILRKILAAVLATVMVCALAGCGRISNDKIVIKKYKGLEITDSTEKVTDDDVQERIDSELAQLGTKTDVTDRPAKDGDVVVIDYEGKVDGVAFEGGTAKEQEIEIGAGGYVDGFVEGIIGHSIGETFDVNVTFPKDYEESLAGKDAVFTMTLHSIQKLDVPKLTEKILPQLSDTAKTVEAYKKEIRKELEDTNAEAAKNSKEQQIWDKLLENCVVSKYPEDQIKEFTDSVESYFGEMAKQNNSTAAEMFKTYYGVSPEDYVKNSIKLEYAIELIAKKEKLSLSEKEYKDGLAEQAEQSGYEDEDEFEKAYGRDTIELLLLQPKVLDFLLDHCKIVKGK